MTDHLHDRPNHICTTSAINYTTTQLTYIYLNVYVVFDIDQAEELRVHFGLSDLKLYIHETIQICNFQTSAKSWL